jgi:hypothetical protein
VNGAKGADANTKLKLARDEFVERAAYTWINRLLALHCADRGRATWLTLEQADAAFADPDAIGWAYQFYKGAAEPKILIRFPLLIDPQTCASV